MVDNRINITPAGKIKGQALQLVQGLPITTENYSTVRNLLVDGQDNKEQTAATYVRQILGLKSMNKGNVGEMRLLVNTFCSNLNALKSIKHRSAARRHHIITAGCRTLGQSDTSRVANETGRRSVPITKEINHIYGTEMSSFGNIKTFQQHC